MGFGPGSVSEGWGGGLQWSWSQVDPVSSDATSSVSFHVVGSGGCGLAHNSAWAPGFAGWMLDVDWLVLEKVSKRSGVLVVVVSF